MSKKKRTVMLGCWGIGGSLAVPTIHERQKVLARGPFAGLTIPSVVSTGMRQLSFDWHLPPLARHTPDGIDMMPYILYDVVTVDKVAFECMLGAKPSLPGWMPRKENVKILECLAADGHIVCEDYLSRLDNPEVAQFVDTMNVLDLSDSNIVSPAIESLQLWIQFWKDLLHFSDSDLPRFHKALLELKSGSEKPRASFGLLYECISDINRVLVLSEQLQQPIYEWEDYLRYYRYKFLRIGKQLPPKGQTLAQLFDVFMPNFEIDNYQQLLDIRHDHRLSSVRQLVDNLGDAKVDKDLVIKANEDVLRMEKRLDTFSKYVALGGYLLSRYLNLPEEIVITTGIFTTSIAKRWLERKVQWQAFFVERALQYKDKQVEELLRQQARDKIV